MLRLQIRLVSAVRTAWPLPAAASLHRHHLLPLSTAAASPAPFVAEDYLVTACGLTPAQALKSSKYLAHLKSAAKTDAVLAFLADAGLAKADVAAAIARNPRLLCSRVNKTLAPRIGKLRDIGLAPAQISSLVAIVPEVCKIPYVIPRLEFLLSFLGCYEKARTYLKRTYFVGRDVERVLKANIAFLLRCGLTKCDIAKIFCIRPNVVNSDPERVKEVVVCVDKLGVPRGSAMFKYALMSVSSIGPEKISAWLDFLKTSIGCSEAEVGTAVRRFPSILNSSEDRLICSVKFLKMEVGLDAAYILRRPALLTYSVKRRLAPRHYVLDVLKNKGLLKEDIDFYYAAKLTEKGFAKKFLDPYKEALPGLAVAYAEQIPPEIKI